LACLLPLSGAQMPSAPIGPVTETNPQYASHNPRRAATRFNAILEDAASTPVWGPTHAGPPLGRVGTTGAHSRVSSGDLTSEQRAGWWWLVSSDSRVVQFSRLNGLKSNSPSSMVETANRECEWRHDAVTAQRRRQSDKTWHPRHSLFFHHLSGDGRGGHRAAR
jgi:hypothetical protein